MSEQTNEQSQSQVLSGSLFATYFEKHELN